MKKYIVLLSLLMLSIATYSQVAINSNGSSPHTSAMLDVSSSSKGLLIPRVYLQSLFENTTIAAPATGLLIYNTNGNLNKGKGFYYNSGTTASPNWQAMHDLILPYTKATSTNGSAFTIENYSQNTASTAIKAVAGGAGNALETVGGVKIAGPGQSPAQGKVLTSDANGNGTWQGAIAFKAVGIKNGASAEFADDVEKKVPFRSILYDISNNFIDAFSSPHSTFTAPAHGIYRFDVKLKWLNPGDGRFWTDVRCKRGNQEFKVLENFGLDVSLIEFGGDVELQAGDQVFVVARQITGATVSLLDWDNDWLQSHFSGRMVTRL
jgi:hypothetical protein